MSTLHENTFNRFRRHECLTLLRKRPEKLIFVYEESLERKKGARNLKLRSALRFQINALAHRGAMRKIRAHAPTFARNNLAALEH